MTAITHIHFMMQSTLIENDPTPPVTRAAARAALGSAIILGFAAERLLFYGPTGPGFVIWVALFGLSAFLIVRQARFEWQRETAIATAIAVSAAVIFAVRASEALHLFAMLVIITAASVPLLRARSFKFGETPLVAQILGLATVGAHAATGVLMLLAGREVGPILSTKRAHSRVAVAARGALLSVPPLVVFGALFVAADPVFEGYVKNITDFITEDFISRVFVVGVFAWITAGLLRSLLPRRSPLADLPQIPTVPSGEVTIALGAVTALFLAFVIVQARWLFSGADALAGVAGLTAADYARRGFFELVMASALTLPMLIATDSLVRPATPAARRTLRLLSATLLVLVLIVMVSALQRMSLYTERFGLTESRLYATAFMAWLGVVFAWFIVTTLRGRRNRFAAGPIAAGIVAAFSLAVLNPDALIARVNLERARHGAEVDIKYLSRLSADAVPQLIRHVNELKPEARCEMARGLLRHNTKEAPDWRTANYSMVRARDLVSSNAAALTSITKSHCPAAQLPRG